MIALPKPSEHGNFVPAWQARFLELLPGIRRSARYAFRAIRAEERAGGIQEVIANCLAAFVRLAERGKIGVACPTPLARFAIRQIRAGRRVGANLNVLDVSSSYAQLAKRFRLQRLDHYDAQSQQWQEIVIEDRHATPADVARVRIDFKAWLKALARRDRRIARPLARGETTGTVAQQFCLSDGRVSQLRRELADSWLAFQGEKPLVNEASNVTA